MEFFPKMTLMHRLSESPRTHQSVFAILVRKWTCTLGCTTTTSSVIKIIVKCLRRAVGTDTDVCVRPTD
jgi:hypothetical protein